MKDLIQYFAIPYSPVILWKKKVATEANSTDFVSSICHDLGGGKPQRIPLGESLEKDPNISHSFAYSFFFSREKGKNVHVKRLKITELITYIKTNKKMFFEIVC